MYSRVRLDVVIRNASVVLESFACEDETLLAMRDSLLLFDFVLELANGVSWFEINGNGSANEVLDEDLHVSRR